MGKSVKSRTSRVAWGRAVCGVLALIALAHLVAVILFGGYRFDAGLGLVSFEVSSVWRSLLAVVVLMGARWTLCLGRDGLRPSVRALLPWGALAAAAGFMATLVAAGKAESLATGHAAVLAALTASGFAFAWMSHFDHIRALRRSAVIAVYLFVTVAVAVTAQAGSPGVLDLLLAGHKGSVEDDAEPWRKSDRVGILAGNGEGVEFIRFQIADDWRNAARVAVGGFFFARVRAAERSTLAFSVAADCTGNCVARAVMGADGSETVLWQQDAASLSTSEWHEVSLELPEHRGTQVMFEVTGEDRADGVVFANPRVLTDAPRGPNVILVVVDCLRADRVGVIGSPRDTTPEIDALAPGATVFSSCHAQSSWTIPSVGSILTSLYPSAHGMTAYGTGLSPSIGTLAERYQRAGYMTGCIQTNPNLAVERGIAQGFNEYLCWHSRPGPGGAAAGYARADAVTARAVEWMGARGKEPFFLYLHYMDPHSPYQPPEEFARFGSEPLGLYEGEVAFFSRAFAELFAAVGDLESTVVVLTSDHGEQFLEHGALEHGNCLYREELHVPLLIWAPGRDGKRVDAIVQTIDIAPTLLELSGLDPLPHARGVSLVSALDGEAIDSRATFAELHSVKEVDHYQASLVADGYRLIVHHPTNAWKRRVQLYDLAADPEEYVNVAAGNPKILDSLLGRLVSSVREQQIVHRRLVPQPVSVVLSEDRLTALHALGYLGAQ